MRELTEDSGFPVFKPVLSQVSQSVKFQMKYKFIQVQYC